MTALFIESALRTKPKAERPKEEIMLKTVEEVAEASDIGSCLRFDTLLKISPIFWENWGIELDPWDPDVRKACVSGYETEWVDTGPEHHGAVAEAAGMSGLGDANAQMNAKMAHFLLRKCVSRAYQHLLDLGCGPGGSTRAVLQSVKVSMVKLVDPSMTVFEAHRDLSNEFPSVSFSEPEETLVEDWLKEDHAKRILCSTDIVLFGASLHHMDLNLVLSELKENLPRNALIGVAEWCHSLLKSPAHFRVLVQNLDSLVEPGILQTFDERFPEGKAIPIQEEPGEIPALMSMAGGFWINHAIACSKNGITPMFSPYEGHIPVNSWIDMFTKHGFKCICSESVNPDNPFNTVLLFRKP